VADIAICIGVGLMAIDMFTSRRTQAEAAAAQAELGPNEAPAPSKPPAAG
jgi:hypothetical protein